MKNRSQRKAKLSRKKKPMKTVATGVSTLMRFVAGARVERRVGWERVSLILQMSGVVA